MLYIYRGEAPPPRPKPFFTSSPLDQININSSNNLGSQSYIDDSDETMNAISTGKKELRDSIKNKSNSNKRKGGFSTSNSNSNENDSKSNN